MKSTTALFLGMMCFAPSLMLADDTMILEKHINAIEVPTLQLEGSVSFSPPRLFVFTTNHGEFNASLDAGRKLREAIEESCHIGCDFTGRGTLDIRGATIWVSISSGEITKTIDDAQLTAGEKTDISMAVQQCWNVGSLSAEALRTTVVVGAELNSDGTMVGDVKLISSDGGSAATEQAFEAARRAVLRCSAGGFNLPVEKYELWMRLS